MLRINEIGEKQTRKTVENYAVTSDDGKSSVFSRGCINFVVLSFACDYHAENFLGFVYLACIKILLRCYL
ncbi:MAG: hypothetical protein H0U87_04700 [Acidobacteria bacterium]|nr:hypothetical protein [Acidobacteriota bacterium]